MGANILLLICGTAFLLLAANLHRAAQKKVIELRPNCLLTRRPFVFVPGKRTPFYFLSYYNQAPHILQEHGYLVQQMSLPWFSSARRQQSLSSQRDRDVIWVMDAATGREFQSLFKDPTQFWIIEGAPIPSKVDQLFFSLHQLFFARAKAPSANLSFDDQLLQKKIILKAIEYAEAEWETDWKREKDGSPLKEINLSFQTTHDRMIP